MKRLKEKKMTINHISLIARIEHQAASDMRAIGVLQNDFKRYKATQASGKYKDNVGEFTLDATQTAGIDAAVAGMEAVIEGLAAKYSVPLEESVIVE